MKRFKLFKMIRKGIEGAILSGGAIEAGIQVLERSEEIDVSQVEHAATVLVAAIVGFTFKAIKNWLKNRDK
jgi:uncharacterized radical SAM superfamily protein